MTKDLKPIIGARLRAARKARNITQATLAEAVSRTEEAISNIERGKSLPPLDLLQKMADVLGVTVVDLLQEAVAPGNLKERAALEMEVRALAETLPIKDLRVAARLIKALCDGS